MLVTHIIVIITHMAIHILVVMSSRLGTLGSGDMAVLALLVYEYQI